MIVKMHVVSLSKHSIYTQETQVIMCNSYALSISFFFSTDPFLFLPSFLLSYIPSPLSHLSAVPLPSLVIIGPLAIDEEDLDDRSGEGVGTYVDPKDVVAVGCPGITGATVVGGNETGVGAVGSYVSLLSPATFGAELPSPEASVDSIRETNGKERGGGREWGEE